MKVLTPLVIILAACLLVVTPHAESAAARASLTGNVIQDDATRAALIERFKRNRNADHKAAYEAAKEFFQKYPDDSGEDALVMKRWMTAYEKVELNVQGVQDSAAGQMGDPNVENSNREPTESETVLWLKKRFDNCTYSYKADGSSNTATQSIENYDKGLITIVTNGTYESGGWFKSRSTFDISSVKSIVMVNKAEYEERVKERNPQLTFEITNGTYGIIFNGPLRVHTEYNNPVNHESNDSRILFVSVFTTDEKEIVEREVKAFNHLLEIAKKRQGKEPF